MEPKTFVYVWDMDETLILMNSLLMGQFAAGYNGSKDESKGRMLGGDWTKLVIDICEKYLFYEELDGCNQPSLDSLAKYDDGRDLSDYDFQHDGFGPPEDNENKRKLSYRFRIAADKYKKDLCNLFDEDLMQKWEKLYEDTDIYTDGWLSAARLLLTHCANGGMDPATGTLNSADTSTRHINLLVSNGWLIPTLAKSALFRLDNLIACENVYSSCEVKKLQCFSWIKERFNGPNVQFCVIGDGWEESCAAQIMGWPFVKIDLQPGSSSRFPGLTYRTLGYYFSIVYGSDEQNVE